MSTPFDTKPSTTAPAAPAKLASDASANYLRSLMLGKAIGQGVTAEAATELVETWMQKGRTQREVSTNIDRLKAEGVAPYRAPKQQDGTTVVAADVPSIEKVPAGRYAVATEEGATNALAFYKVDRPTDGRWAGYVFVKLIVSDDEQRMSKAAGNAILAKIAAVGAAEASATYGLEIGKCGVCGRTLTNDESRERGIGPVCAARLGW